MALTGSTLRDFSSALSVVAITLILWRFVGTYGHLSHLAKGLGYVVLVNLTAGAIAQVLLAQADAPPPNTTGVWLIVLGRASVIVLAVMWTRLVRHRPFHT